MAVDSPSTLTPKTPTRLLGVWHPAASDPAIGEAALVDAIENITRPVYVVEHDGRYGVAHDGSAAISFERQDSTNGNLPLLAYAAPLLPEQLGDAAFCETHGLRYPYVAGAMANGITSVEMVEAMARAGMLGFFGAAGLEVPQIADAIERLQGSLGKLPFGTNLIHSPADPRLEAETVELYLRRGVRLISASAYLELTLPLIRYRVSGIHRGPDGEIVAPNRVVAKVSRVEIARKFFAPPPAAMLETLVSQGVITAEQAELAAQIPVADDLTAEADSGGHTDNRPALALLPTMLALRDDMQRRYEYTTPLRVGAAGGIATPISAAAAFGMGAAYILTGTINQSCVEAGTSPLVRKMLAEASQADVIMAPAADMFEMGVKVQVLKRGTMFAIRAKKLYDLYRTCDSFEALPPAQRALLERDFFRAPLEDVWRDTQQFFATRDPQQVTRAERDPKHKLALIFRSYLGRASGWANAGDESRQVDYQVWCGPAMGAFNEWVRGSVLDPLEDRDVVTVALNLLVGAAALTRAGWLRAQGIRLPAEAQSFTPRTRDELAALVPEQ